MSSCPSEYFISPETPSFNLHVISLLISSFSIPYSYFLLLALGNIANELTQLDFMLDSINKLEIFTYSKLLLFLAVARGVTTSTTMILIFFFFFFVGGFSYVISLQASETFKFLILILDVYVDDGV